MTISADRTLAVLCLLACVLVTGMLGMFATTGIGQDPLQFVHPAAEYTRILLRDPPSLRTVIGLDNLFLVVYSAVFSLMAARLWQAGAPRTLLVIGTPLLLATGLLDMLENFHVLAMLAGAEQGIALQDAQIGWQAVESMFKFHLSYLGLLLLGLSLPRRTGAQRVLAFLLCVVQWPLGVAIYVVPHAVAVPLVFARFGFFLAAFMLVAWTFGRGESSGRAAGSAAALAA